MTRDKPTTFSILMLVMLPVGTLFEVMLRVPADSLPMLAPIYIGISAGLAYADNADLLRDKAVTDKFWGWAFVLPLVFLIIRSRRIGGNYSHAVLWVLAAVTSFVLSAAYGA